jgi:hypothetical protein
MARRWPFKQQTVFERFQGWRPTLEKPDRERPADGLPQDIDQHMRLMCDILVLAFQTDTTRFCTLKLNNDISSLRFTNLGIGHTIHHMLSHQESDNWSINSLFARLRTSRSDSMRFRKASEHFWTTRYSFSAPAC